MFTSLVHFLPLSTYSRGVDTKSVLISQRQGEHSEH